MRSECSARSSLKAERFTIAGCGSCLATTGWRDDSSGTYSDRPAHTDTDDPSDVQRSRRRSPVSGLPAEPRNDVEAHESGSAWFERAQMTEDQLTRLLFLFFALEAILGDRSAQ